jgi:hypothetical protein
MRLGGVLVMMRREKARRITTRGTATHSVARATSHEATTQPSTPPPVARAGMPSDASG